VAIRNPHTRQAYARAVEDFLAWCEAHGVPSLGDVRPLHVADQVVPTNPAASVRGPRHSVHVGKTPVLEPAEAPGLAEEH
jgi:integrase/recombinase XerC